ncbi:MAG: hypothetical protein ACJASX_004062, partial [Limisphaerales bacterium]
MRLVYLKIRPAHLQSYLDEFAFRQGAARHGTARHGTARHGKARV